MVHFRDRLHKDVFDFRRADFGIMRTEKGSNVSHYWHCLAGAVIFFVFRSKYAGIDLYAGTNRSTLFAP